MPTKEYSDENSYVKSVDLSRGLKELRKQIGLPESPNQEESLRELLERLEDKVDLLNSKVDLIFGRNVLVSGTWIDLLDLKKE